MVEFYNINGKKILSNIEKRGTGMDLPKELSKVVQKMKVELKNRMLDTRYRDNFAVNFEQGVKPDFYAKNIALFIERDLHTAGQSFLGISVLHPTIARDSRTYLINGSLEQILEYIERPDFNKELERTVLALSEDLKNSL